MIADKSEKYFVSCPCNFYQHNNIIVLMVPAFDNNGNLPPGVHNMEWGPFVARFGGNSHRKRLIAGLLEGLRSLRRAGCQRVYIDGSFVTDKEMVWHQVPSDFDLCWDVGGVDPTLLDPTLLDFANKRAAQKAKYGGEFFPSIYLADTQGNTFFEFFQIDKNTGLAKGIISLDLQNLP